MATDITVDPLDRARQAAQRSAPVQGPPLPRPVQGPPATPAQLAGSNWYTSTTRPQLPAFGSQVTGNTPLSQRLNLPLLTPQQAAAGLYMGESPVMRGPGVTYEPQFVDPNESWKSYLTLPQAAKDRLAKILDAKRGAGNWGMQEMDGLWSTGIQGSMYATQMTGQRKTPMDVLEDFYLRGDTSVFGPAGPSGGSGGGSGGGGGGYAGPTTQVSLSLTDKDTAATLLNNSLEQYLGRSASVKERRAFLNALNAHEAANPQVTVNTPNAGSHTNTSVGQGGSNPAQFAEDYAMKQPGSEEYLMATKYLDGFMQSLQNPADVVQ